MSTNISHLINDYLEAAQNNIQEMKHYFGVVDLILARRKGLIPPEGSIPRNGGMQFTFHGIGCRVETTSYSIDFDFDEDHGCSGFDGWRLWLFAESQPGRYDTLRDLTEIKEELQDLEQAGLISKSIKSLNPGLYQIR